MKRKLDRHWNVVLAICHFHDAHVGNAESSVAKRNAVIVDSQVQSICQLPVVGAGKGGRKDAQYSNFKLTS